VIALQAKKEIYIFLLTLSNFLSVLSKFGLVPLLSNTLIELIKERKKGSTEGKRNEVNREGKN
jgi:hypothetical protein